MIPQRRRYLFEGRVQGVGFRMTARRIAQAHPVTGSVRNLHDGRVEIVIEGEPQAVADCMGAIRREFEGYIDRVDELPAPTSEPPYSSFEIRY